jgi:imidazolonepropionase-like amidohydrolase
MLRIARSGMLLAIVASVVGQRAAAGGPPCQGPATTAGASGYLASGAVPNGQVARAAGESVAPGRPAPQAADGEIRHSVLMAGRPIGRHTVRRTGDGALHFTYEFNDRGRGASLTVRVLMGPDGVPRLIETDGHDYYKNKVRDRFAIVDGKASWQSAAEQGTRSLPSGTTAFYLSFNAVPAESALLARALLAAPGKTLEILPSGKATIERVGTLEVRSDAAARSVTHYEISGLGFTPASLWLDDNGALFAEGSEWSMVIREGWESAAKPLLVEQSRRSDERQAQWAKTLSRRPKGDLVFTHCRLFDAAGARTIPDTTIVVSANRIAQVGPDGGVAIPENAEVVDATGKTILPGLWDMHVHLGFETSGLQNLAAGVTSVRDLGNDTDKLMDARRKFEDSTALGPRVVMAGFLDCPGPFAGPTNVLVDTAHEAEKAIDRYKMLGYEQIKVYSSIKREMVPAIIARAHGHGMRVSGHVPAFMTAQDVVELGFDEVQHINFLFLNFLAETVKDTRTAVRLTAVADQAAELDLKSAAVQRFIALLKEHDTVIDPTLRIFEANCTDRPGTIARAMAPVADRLPPNVRRAYLGGGLPVPEGKDERYRESFEAMLRMVAALHRAGVRMVAGTDSTGGFSMQRELELYVQAGIPAPEVLRMATLGAAAVMKHDDELGTIAPGKLADLIVVDGDPTARISEIRRVRMVVKNGTMLKPDELYRTLGVAAAK